ncbi:MAG: beta-ketoacyl synthase N-terminal-like domain-containing protein, partial [Parvibaculum sp.]
MRRVVVTGMAGVTPLGSDWSGIRADMAAGRTGVRYIEDWDRLGDLRTRLGAPAGQFEQENIFPSKNIRS